MTDNKSGEILIIEDDKDINDLLATALSKAGYRTRQAWSGTEGELLLKLDREAYALVLLDLMLPGLSGEELLARIRQMDASLPVIILTAKDELDEKINLLVAGADDYITKPFEIKEVVARVAVQLRHAVADVPSKSGKAGENQTKAENDTGQGDTANTYIAGPAKIEHRQLVLDRISRQLYVADNAVDGITKQEFAILELLMAHPRQVFAKEDIFEYAWDEPYIGETTFLGRFKDFQMLEVTESTDYLVYKLKEAYTYTKLVPLIEDTAKVVKEDSIKAIQYLKEEIEKLEKSVPVSRNKDGYDIISNAGDRLTEYKKRCEVKGLIGIPTGIPKLDEITNGWLWGEDLVVLTGRTNVGKTWIGEYFATMAWNMGYKILMYSGEMSTAMVGFRFDTLNKHFSNMGLLNGSGTLGKKPDTDGAKYLQEDYEKYITQLQQKSGFIVVTPDDFEGRKPNVDEIKSLAIKHGADMIVIDQLSLMSDKRRADIPRIAYNNISEDLFLMSKELKKPVLLMAQANREAVKNRKKGESPELHDLAESDGVGQNATRVLSLSVIDGTLKISIKKNRYGINNKEVLMIWEVNTGYLKPLLSENPEESTEDKKDDKPDGEQDKGGEKDYGF